MPPSHTEQSSSVSPLLVFMVPWVVLSTFNYGFGISELNPLQSVLTCTDLSTKGIALPSCFPLTSSEFGFITALFTLGGLLASLVLSPLTSLLKGALTRRRSLFLGAVLNCAGTAAQAFSRSSSMLGFGRALMGMSAGIGIVIVPAYLSDIAPPSLRGSIGVLNQLSIVTGILVAQALGVSSFGTRLDSAVLTDFAPWRYVPLVSFGVSTVQLVLFPLTVDSPSDLSAAQRITLRSRLTGHGGPVVEEEENEGLLAGQREYHGQEATDRQPYTVSYLLKVFLGTRAQPGSPQAKLQRGVGLIVFTQLAQQLSGVNAVLYYSSSILADALGKGGDSDATAKRIALGITVVNALMTFPPMYLISEARLGRRGLLLLSSGTMCLSSLALTAGILLHLPMLSAAALVVVVAAFSVGLGPVPFLILPELVEEKAVSPASALGISINWTAALTLASLFLPLRNALASLDGGSGGSVFLVFALINAVSTFGVARWYRTTTTEQAIRPQRLE